MAAVIFDADFVTQRNKVCHCSHFPRLCEQRAGTGGLDLGRADIPRPQAAETASQVTLTGCPEEVREEPEHIRVFAKKDEAVGT